ncbi:MAG TPA: hypothetical protein DDZ80_12185 [Cyanobacteria bacterium UBA8803]|nr:hypothetical protein [Cyanobacteria bacterium UBA9273]HBL59238.1 hypothetical protein [Cyanobacteria bacterium UBA8803]
MNIWLENSFKKIFKNVRSQAYNFIIPALWVTILIVHLFQLDSLPAGLYLDETSIGYNAALIAQSGKDEYGIDVPIYFKAFGEYKNPIYIYAAAIIFKFFGISEFNLRFTSFLFYIFALFFTVLLTNRLFKQSKIIQVYSLMSLGFLPHYFVLSRISFEVICYLTWISAALFIVNITFSESQRSNVSGIEIVLGLIIGTSIYTYSIARLLCFLMLVSLWVAYYKRNHIRKLLIVTVFFGVSLIPYFIFTATNPGAITLRFRSISYIYQPLPLIKKIIILFRNLISYWSPDFLITHGDANLRHSTGYGGVIFIITWLLFIVGIVAFITNKNFLFDRFNIFILMNLFLSPLAAVLTSEGTPHALRSFLLSYYIFLVSCYGLRFILLSQGNYNKQIMLTCLLGAFAFEIAGYQLNYFISYPAKSIYAMGSFDFKASLQTAINNSQTEVVFVNVPSSSYANLKFYSYLVKNPNQIPINMSDKPKPRLGNCLLYAYWAEQGIENVADPFIEYKNTKQLNPLKRLLGVKPTEAIMKVRCYKKL